MLLKRTILICLSTMLMSAPAWNQVIPSFSQLLSQLEASPEADKNQFIEQFIAQNGGTPIVEGDTVIFMARKNGDLSPVLLADFNGFLNPRYVQDKGLGKMEEIPGSSWFYFKKKLPPAAIVNYNFAYGDKRQNDPLNPNLRLWFGNLISFVQMSGYVVSPEIIIDHSIPKGQVAKEVFPSHQLGHDRTLHIYLPPGYEKMTRRLPVLFLHDGTFYVNEARIPQILDYLIARQQIQPLIAVFDDPVIRGKEYRGDAAFRDYVGKELIPHIDKQYKTAATADQRAVIGASRGGLSALHLSHGLPLFGKCGAFSPAIIPTTIPDFLTTLENYPYNPHQLFISASIFDYIWYPDAVELKKHFENSELDFQYREIPEGHNIPAWRSLLDEMLVFFFPFEE